MKNKTALVYVRYLTALCSACLFALVLSGCQFGTFSGQTLENPKETIVDFIDTLQTENFDIEAAEAANQYVGNYSTMGFEKYALVEEGSFEEVLFDMLRESYKIEFSDDDLSPISSPYQGTDMNISGKQAYVTFTFSSLNLDKVSEPLAEMVSEVGAERVYDGASYESEESALVLVQEVLEMMTAENDMSGYCTERELTLELNYREDGWKISVSDEFYDALLGN